MLLRLGQNIYMKYCGKRFDTDDYFEWCALNFN